MNRPQSNLLRTLLVLGRVSNLPTVWSNCLAAWLLGGAGTALLNDGGREWARFGLVCLGATLLYAGGMYLNDAFDAQFDEQHRRERPIPSGAIRPRLVWQLGSLWLVLGVALLAPFGWMTGLNALLLAGCILVYDATHKLVTFSPVLMALCRFFLYIVAASASPAGLTGLTVWSGFALASYMVGLSYLARKESTNVLVQLWPMTLLVVPLILAILVNDREYRTQAWLVGLILVLWTMRSLRPAFIEPKNVGRAVSGLLAGIVLVDWLAVPNEPRVFSAAFVGLFLLALLFQRFVPAT